MLAKKIGQEKLLVKKNVLSKKKFVKKNYGKKKIWLSKNFGPKKYFGKTILVKKGSANDNNLKIGRVCPGRR